jgi:hypothetical protein
VFDLSNYEDVNSRIKRFRSEFPSGRLVAYVEDADLQAGWVLIKAEAYREFEDVVPSAVDYAYGNVATYPANLKKWFCEDTITSAYGRVIGLLTPSQTHAHRSTAQDMQKVETTSPISNEDPWATLTIKTSESEGTAEPVGNVLQLVAQQLGGEIVESSPSCTHGRMIYKEGKSAKTGNAYKGYTCPSKVRTDQCKPVWL